MNHGYGSFTPIQLPKAKYIIKREGYFDSVIEEIDIKERNKETVLKVNFEIAKGKYKGFKLITYFYESFKSRIRLAHLCNTVGITGELTSPDQLVGKAVRLRIVPRKNRFTGKYYYRITRFHPIDRDM